MLVYTGVMAGQVNQLKLNTIIFLCIVFSAPHREGGRIIFGRILDKSSGFGQIFGFWTKSLVSWTIFQVFFNISLIFFSSKIKNRASLRDNLVDLPSCHVKFMYFLSVDLSKIQGFVQEPTDLVPNPGFLSNTRIFVQTQRFCPST